MSQGCAEQSDTPVELNGLSARATKYQCVTGLQYNNAGMFALRDLTSIAFTNSVDQLSPQQAVRLRPFVRYEEGVYEKAAEFVSRSFGGEPFLAIHWRQTDFLQVRRTQPGVLQSASDVVRHAQAVMKRHGITRVYLATDSDSASDLDYVFTALSPTRFAADPMVGGLRTRVDVANVEVAICAMADQFLGTKTSSFTLAIVEERQAIFRKPKESGAEMGALPALNSAASTPSKKDEL